MFKPFMHAALFASAMLLAGTAVAQQSNPSMSKQSMSNPSMSQQDSAAMARTLPRDPALKPVFEEFGGKAGLTAMVDDFMVNLMADPRTRPFFAPVNRTYVKKELVLQFCVILDGPCKYTGGSMAAVHHGMKIQRADFNALVEDLQKAMTKHNVPFRAQNKLLAKLAPMHKDIINEK
jgi:hemoglobin